MVELNFLSTLRSKANSWKVRKLSIRSMTGSGRDSRGKEEAGEDMICLDLSENIKCIFIINITRVCSVVRFSM